MSVAVTRKRDPEATRGSILQAAEKLFVARGFAATSMSDIASEAGVTKSLIHHHFGSKEDLWDEVKRQRVSHYVEAQKRVIAEEDDGRAGVLRRSIESYFNFLRDNPEFVRLSLWMSLEDPRLAEASFPELVPLGLERIQEEQAAGRVRSDVDPRHLIAMFVSMCSHWFSSRSGVFAGENRDDAAYLEDVLRVYFHGIRPR